MRLAVLILLLILASCGSSNSCSDMQFSRLRTADRVVVTLDSRNTLSTITSGPRISALAAFAEAHATGWGARFGGPPIARLNAEFFAADRFLGDFGVDSTFLSAQGCGYFQTRSIGGSDRRQLIALLGVPDPEKN
jgi:hypothetical protein